MLFANTLPELPSKAGAAITVYPETHTKPEKRKIYKKYGEFPLQRNRFNDLKDHSKNKEQLPKTLNVFLTINRR